MSEKRDKFLTEAMGECWHKAVSDFESVDPPGYFTGVCECGELSDDHHGFGRVGLDEYTFDYPAARTNFSTWEGFGKLWEWVPGQEWYRDFLIYIKKCVPQSCVFPKKTRWYIHPDRFANAVYEFLKEK